MRLEGGLREVHNAARHNNNFIRLIIINGEQRGGTRRSSWLRHCAKSRKVASSISDAGTGLFDIIPPHYGRGIDTGSNRNEYQKYFLKGKKRPVCRACNLYHIHVALSRNLGVSAF